MNRVWLRDRKKFVSKYAGRIRYLEGVGRLDETVVGLVGFGRIGKAVCVRLRALGARVCAYDPYVDVNSMRDLGAEPCNLEQLLSAVDVLSLHVPLTPDTYQMIGGRQLLKMRPTAHLVNTARAQVVDEDALVNALGRGRLAGAALDVTTIEPLSPDHPLFELENVIVTPHVAFYSDSSLRNVKEQVATYVVNALLGTGEFVRARL